MIIPGFSRRQILAAAATLPIVRATPGSAGVRVIRGRTFNGAPASTDIGVTASDGMVILDCTFTDLGNGGVVVDQPVNRLIVQGCRADRLYRFFENTVSINNGHDASLTNFAIRRVEGRDLRRGMTRIRYASAHGLLEDVTAYGSDDCANYCVGFALDGQAHDITYRRVQAHGFIEAHRGANKYWNGDGFSDERGNSDIRYQDCLATDCSDGGFDVKSTNVLLERCVARTNKRNFRLWSSGRLVDCASHEPKWRGGSGGKSHFSFHGDVEKYVFERPVVRAPEGNTAPVFLFATNGPATIDIIDAEIDAPSAPLIEVQGPQPNIRFIPDRARQNIRTAAT